MPVPTSFRIKNPEFCTQNMFVCVLRFPQHRLFLYTELKPNGFCDVDGGCSQREEMDLET